MYEKHTLQNEFSIPFHLTLFVNGSRIRKGAQQAQFLQKGKRGEPYGNHFVSDSVPFLAALVMSCMKQHGLLRRTVQFTFCGVIVAAVIVFAVTNLIGGKTVAYLPHTHVIDMGMLLVEWGLVALGLLLQL